MHVGQQSTAEKDAMLFVGSVGCVSETVKGPLPAQPARWRRCGEVQRVFKTFMRKAALERASETFTVMKTLPKPNVNKKNGSVIHISEPTRLLSIRYSVSCWKQVCEEPIAA